MSGAECRLLEDSGDHGGMVAGVQCHTQAARRGRGDTEVALSV